MRLLNRYKGTLLLMAMVAVGTAVCAGCAAGASEYGGTGNAETKSGTNVAANPTMNQRTVQETPSSEINDAEKPQLDLV